MHSPRRAPPTSDPSRGMLPVVIRTMRRLCALLITAVASCAFLGVGAAAAAQWQWPLAGQPAVVRGFDPPATPYGAGHRGVDLASRPGLPVRAAGAGSIGYAGLLAGRGVVTVLHAGGLRTTYEPLMVAVHPGDRVAAGAVLGHLAAGHPGCPAAACLHWGLLRGETYLDPLSLLGIGRVRLFPLAGHASSALRVSAGTALMTGAGALPMLLWLGAHRTRARRAAVSAGRPSSRAAG